MNWLRQIGRRYDAFRRKEELEREMDEEMRLHIAMEAEEISRTRGLAPEEAMRRARQAFGGIDRFKEEGRDARGTRGLESFVRDIAYVGRGLRRNRVYALSAVFTLAIGLAGATAIFALVDGILLRPLPYSEADRLVAVKHRLAGPELDEAGLTSGAYVQYRDRTRSFEAIASYWEAQTSLSDGEDEIERVRVAHADPELFRVLRTGPVIGRVFTEEDWTPVIVRRGTAIGINLNQRIPILLSHEFWRRRYGGNSDVIGRVVTLGGSPREIVGILPPGFAFPSTETQIWVLSIEGSLGGDGTLAGLGHLGSVARLRSGVEAGEAEAELRNILRGLVSAATNDQRDGGRVSGEVDPIVVPLKRAVIGTAGRPLWVLFGCVGLLLLVGTANIANLFLARMEDRTREMSVRSALGARGSEIFRLLFAEALVVCTGAAVIGITLAYWSVSVVPRLPFELPRVEEVGVSARTLLFTVGAALVIATTLCLLAGAKYRAREIPAGVREIATGGGGREGQRTRDTLVAVQVALTLVLLVGGALMARSFLALASVERGFDADGVWTVEVSAPSSRWREVESIYANLLDEVNGIPGVTSAAVVTSAPLAGRGGTESGIRRIAPSENSPVVDPMVPLLHFSSGYFRVMRTPVLEGSGIDNGDQPGVDNPVVVSGALARRLFGGESALGQQIHRLEIDGSISTIRGPLTIVGVVADVREDSQRSDPAELLYVPLMQPPVETGIAPMAMTLIARTDVPPASIAASVRSVIRGVDPAMTIGRTRTLGSIVADSMAKERFMGMLLMVAGGASLLMGSIGVYGIVAYAVRRRAGEIGIRMALGARAATVILLVMRESIATVLAGLVVGVVAANLASRALRPLLFEVGPGDPRTLALIASTVMIVAFTAAFVAASRVARLGTATILRAE